MKIFCYEDVANLPPGVEVCDAGDVLDRKLVFERREELGLAPYIIADLFRLAMLMKGVGVWCDCDYAMIRPLPAFEDILLGAERNGKLCNAVLWLPPDNELMPAVIDAFLKLSVPPWTYAKPRWRRFRRRLLLKPPSMSDYPLHQWGRHALEYFVRRQGLKGQVKPYKTFYYPVIYDDYLFRPNPFQHILDDPEVRGLHCFYKPPEAFRAAGEGSFVGWLKEAYGDALEPSLAV